MRLDREYAVSLDRADPLASFRSRFAPVEEGLIYLDGNSLGRLPLASGGRVESTVASEWGERLVRGWGDGWIHWPQRLGAKIAPLIGAQEDEVIVCDSTSVNFFKLACAALRHQAQRTGIVTDDLNFPSDVYLLQGLLSPPPAPSPLAGTNHPESGEGVPGGQLNVVISQDGMTIDEGQLRDAVSGDTALLTLSHTSFASAFIHDMDRVTKIAHDKGAMMLWDLSHSVGSMPIELNRCRADLAVGCTYKYLNGGPGSPAFLYVRKDLQDKLSSPIWGWMGQNRPFDLGLQYEPAKGISRFLAGTPPIVSMAALEPAISMVAEAGLGRIREKSIKLTEFLIAMWEAELEPIGVRLNSPRESAKRGSHVSLGHDEAWRISMSLIQDMNVIPDFREPDNIRFGLTPLYTTFDEVWEAVSRLKAVLTQRLYENHSKERTAVT